jgi:hypothetical protein
MLRSDLEAPEDQRQLGKGWISGVAALVLAISGFLLVVCLHFPSWFTVPEIRALYGKPLVHIGLQVCIPYRKVTGSSSSIRSAGNKS